MSVKWRELGKSIAKAGLPILGGAVAGPGGSALGAAIAGAIGGDPGNAEQLETIVKSNPDAVIRLRELETNAQVEIQRLLMQQATAEIAAESETIVQVNETMRAEYATQDKFRGSWRPFFGYVVAITWAVQMGGATFAAVWTITEDPGNAGEIIKALGEFAASTAVMWSMALAMLGVAIKQRSNDKAAAMGQRPGGFLAGLFNRSN